MRELLFRNFATRRLAHFCQQADTIYGIRIIIIQYRTRFFQKRTFYTLKLIKHCLFTFERNSVTTYLGKCCTKTKYLKLNRFSKSEIKLVFNKSISRFYFCVIVKNKIFFTEINSLQSCPRNTHFV